MGATASGSGWGIRLRIAYACNYSTRAVEALDPIALAHVFHSHFAARCGSMHEAVFPEIDADMRKAASQGIEENKVSREEFFPSNGFAHTADLLRCARQNQAEGFAEDMSDQATAIESGFRRFSAALIVDSDKCKGAQYQVPCIICIVEERGAFQIGWRNIVAETAAKRTQRQTQRYGNLS